MKAMVLRKYNQPLVLEEVEMPRIGAREVLIQVKACGVCASNVKYVEGAYPDVLTLPHILGHEPVGEVVKVGPEVQGVVKGDRVCVYIFIPCGECLYCGKGEENNCLHVNRIGMEVSGAYAEYIKAPARNVFKIPEGVSYEEAAVLADAAATSFHAIREKAKVRVGDDVVIMGIGSLGINGVQIAKAAGARVIAIDILPSKLEFARKYGADEMIDGRKEDIATRVRSLTGGKGVDSFIDFVGSADSVRAGLHSLRRAGKLVVVGHDPYHPFQVKAFQELIMEEVEIIGSHASTRQELREILNLVQIGKLKPVIGARYPLAQANEAHQAIKGGGIFGRIVLLP
jgi:2-desacetyl-2-hydroxyethyl bacteriochlorophyllide A dehydrogenase